MNRSIILLSFLVTLITEFSCSPSRTVVPLSDNSNDIPKISSDCDSSYLDLGPVYYLCLDPPDFQLMEDFAKKRKRYSYSSPFQVLLKGSFLRENSCVKVCYHNQFDPLYEKPTGAYLDTLIALKDLDYTSVILFLDNREYSIPINPLYKRITVSQYITSDEYFQNTLVYYYENKWLKERGIRLRTR